MQKLKGFNRFTQPEGSLARSQKPASGSPLDLINVIDVM
jgi:hypothetical protein